MVNRKSIALASAILLFVVVQVAGQGGEEIFEYGARVVAEVTDIDGVPIDVSLTRGEAPPSHEQIVEGHTVFHTMDIIPPAPANQTAINVVGLVECRYEIVNLTIPSFAVDRIWAECNVGGSIYTTEPKSTPPNSPSDLQPTGWEKLVPRPDTGELVHTIEYSYWTTRVASDGSRESVLAYCWETTILDDGTNPHTLKPFNFVSAINPDRLKDGEINRLRIVTADDFFALST